MPAKLKKTKSAGRFGARYGKRSKMVLVKVEEKQRVKLQKPQLLLKEKKIGEKPEELKFLLK